MDTRSLHGKLAVVTGAGSGIGRETARLCAQRGADLALCDIDEAGLEQTAEPLRAQGCSVWTQRVDVADAGSMAAFATAVHERHSAVDLLVNNAGVAVGGGFLDTTLEDWDWILGVNVRGVVHGCHAFVPHMVERGAGGHVVVLSSMAGYWAIEALAAYSASKFCVLGLAESLRLELAPHRIGVTAVCPGIVNTAITRNSRLRGEADTEAMRAEVTRNYEKRNYGPERVADAILKAVGRNRAVAPVTPEAWALYYAKRFAPRLSGWLAGRIGARIRSTAQG